MECEKFVKMQTIKLVLQFKVKLMPYYLIKKGKIVCNGIRSDIDTRLAEFCSEFCHATLHSFRKTIHEVQ